MAAKETDIISFRLSDGSSIKLEYHESLSSTAALAREYAMRGYPDRYVVMTERQTSTPITRTHLSPGIAENGIFMSIILRPSVFPSQAGLLSHLCAVALAGALDEHTTSNISIGWVSDIYSDGRRIGGCAIEGKLTDFSSFEYLVVSFAVKVNERTFPPRITDIIRKVFESGNRSVGVIIAKTIINNFFSVYAKLRSPEKCMEKYRKRFLLLGKKIKYIENGKKHTARVFDIDKSSGALILELRSGEKRIITSPSGIIPPARIK